ncbi:hypothetical protein QJS04_geneDACA007706 [Acorus gramineus]|uniref:Uncharacterized protein n=1 Tax=Acorus gramineus TaxID=55184 RepID=A0AAV9B0X8_ACOGR|nr:hypothetical protein QJS04_geneDACA007706 [Acorus gramineus]
MTNQSPPQETQPQPPRQSHQGLLPLQEESLTGDADPNPSKSTVMGTIYGHRHGTIRFCVEYNDTHHLLLDLGILTSLFAKEIDSGPLRIALECDADDDDATWKPLRSVPTWKVCLSGRSVGYAVKRWPTDDDRSIMDVVGWKTAAVGVIEAAAEEKDEVVYMRGRFERVVGGGGNSETYHLMNPGGTPGDELSVFLIRGG